MMKGKGRLIFILLSGKYLDINVKWCLVYPRSMDGWMSALDLGKWAAGMGKYFML